MILYFICLGEQMYLFSFGKPRILVILMLRAKDMLLVTFIPVFLISRYQKTQVLGKNVKVKVFVALKFSLLAGKTGGFCL